MRTRSRILYAMESRISARLPPTWCWMLIAVAISSRSSDRTRRTMFSSAWSNGRPRLTSRMTRPNSVEIGGRDFRTRSSIAWRNEEPARSAFAMSVIVSGSCLLNEFRRPLFRRPSQNRGSMNPMNPPMSRNKGLPNDEMRGESSSTTSGIPIVIPAQMSRNSDGLSRRSARAMSRARLAPKSRRSTTLLRLASASLCEISSATPPCPFVLAGSGFAVVAYLSRRSEIPELPEVAMATAMRTIARAATPAIASAVVSTGRCSFPCLVGEPEESGRKVDAHDFELLDELRPDARRLQPALDLAFDDTGLLEDEHVLHDDDVAFHPLDLGDVDDLSRAVLESRLLDDQIHGRCDLLADRPQWQVDTGHQDHRLESGQHVARAVRVARRHRPVVAGVHRLEHVEGLARTALPDDDPIRAHAEGVADELADGDRALAFDVRRAGLERDHVLLAELELGGVLDRDDPLVIREEGRQDVEGRGLSGAGAAGHEDVHASLHTCSKEVEHVCGGLAESDEVVDRERRSGELPDGDDGPHQ